MRIQSVLVNERRVLLLGAISAALHLLAIALIARPNLSAPRADAGPRIAVTLRPAAPAPSPAAAVTAPPAARPSARRPAAPSKQAIAASEPPAAPAPRPAALPSLPLPLPGAGWEAVAAGQGEALVQMPGRYRVQPPPPAVLSYTVTRGVPGQAPEPAGAGLVDWRNDSAGYRLRVEGVLGALDSAGGMSDAGIAPASAAETLADGSRALTRFDERERRIAFSGSARSHRLLGGSQDRASLLMQLAGMGLADPDQIKDVLEFFVGASTDAGVVRFQVVGEEQLDSALGALACVHLVQLAEPGQARLEVWLAPQRHWYPVQLRVTEADGSVSTQQLTAIAAPPDGKAP